MARTAWLLLGLLLFSLAQAQAPSYFVYADVVRGHVNPKGAVCVPNTVFQQGEHAVFRVAVADAATGELLTAEEVEARGVTVTVDLQDVIVLELAFSPHPPEVNLEWFFVSSWFIPADQATGSYGWTVSVSDAAGGTGSFTPIGASFGSTAIQVVEAVAESPLAGLLAARGR